MAITIRDVLPSFFLESPEVQQRDLEQLRLGYDALPCIWGIAALRPFWAESALRNWRSHRPLAVARMLSQDLL
jgi:hypothetical protein